jgi:hypothetical protein
MGGTKKLWMSFELFHFPENEGVRIGAMYRINTISSVAYWILTLMKFSKV